MIIVGRVEILNVELTVTVPNNTTPVQSFRMADTKYSRSKSPKSYKAEEFSKPKIRKSKHHNRKEVKESKQQVECKTPPLPPSSSLDDLLKQRDDLKEELEKITKHSKYDLEIRHNLNENRIKYNNLNTPQLATKRSYVEESDTHNIKKNRKISEQPYGIDECHIDSDDEENIIEQRRKQRKQLLEKLNFSHTNKPDDTIGNSDKQKNDHGNNLNAEDVQIISEKSELMKEPTDMFSDKDFSNNKPDIVTQDNSNAQLSDNWDDAEGYYNVRVGDQIDSNKYTIKSILGQGVFANVVLAQENKSKTDIAIKIMRNNDLIFKTGLKELALLKAIDEADPESKHHCIKFIRNFMHKGHLCVVLEPLYMDMRKVIKKYGKHGLNMKAVVSYSRQLLLALRLLKKMGIVHADVKPDNILVNEKKNLLKLCDFGSASKVNENEMTPYLVSRFYRAPEIILGLPYKHSIDVWSAACTVYEMATGKIMFIGSSNNKMLKCFMDLKGKVPSKLIRKGKFKDQHFNYKNSFLLHKKDEVSGREKFVELGNINATRDLLPELKKAHKNANIEIEYKLIQLKDFLEKMLALDSNHRLSINDCLKHPFIQESVTK